MNKNTHAFIYLLISVVALTTYTKFVSSVPIWNGVTLFIAIVFLIRAYHFSFIMRD